MSYLRGLICLVFVAVAAVMVSAEKDFKMGRSEVRVEANSGMMEFRRHRPEMANETAERRPVQIRMAQVVQLDKDGNEVTNCSVADPTTQPSASPSRRKRAVKPGKPGHNPGMFNPADEGKMHPHRSWIGKNGTGPGRRFSNFAETKFKIEKKRAHELLKHSRKALKALWKRFHAQLGEGVGKMAIDMALPENDGEIEIDGEKQKLRKGDLKFNIELSEWSWCGEEGDEGAAAFLDVYIEVNSTLSPRIRRPRTASTPASFDLGDNTTMSLSGKVKRDDRWVNVVEGYPKVDSKDPSLIIVRFTRFNSSLLYDPTVSAEDEANEDNKSNDARRHSVSAIFVAMATTLTYALLK